jgi:LysR family glycine cleavage system transcriptional activator
LKRGDIPSIGGLTSFIAAAQHGSFTRAGSELELTQSAVSRQIHELESHLGVRLFERVRQRVVLTDAGKLYLSHVKKALDDLTDATRRVVALSNGTTLNLVVLPTFGVHWLGPRLSNFQNKNPGITINITTRQRPMDYAVEPFDAAIFYDNSKWPGTIAHHLVDEDVHAVCSPKLYAKHAIRTPADIAKFPLLHSTSRPGRWAEWMMRAGLTPPDTPLPGHAYQSYAMLAQAAIDGVGIALLPSYLIELDIVRNRLEVVGRGFSDLKTSYYLILPEARASSNAVQAFSDWLIAEVRSEKAADGIRAIAGKSSGR